MIVLGPHVLHHVTEDDEASLSDAQSSGDRQYSYNTILSTSGGDINYIDGIIHDSATATNSSSVLEEVRYNTMLFQARMKVSKSLGSIGAPPLPSLNERNSNEKYMVDSAKEGQEIMIKESTNINDTESYQTYLESIVDLTVSNTELLHTIQTNIHMLTVGTGIRLGTGSTSARRAERAWLGKKLRHQGMQEGTMTQSYKPKLTLHRCRQILHQTIVDQTTFLQKVASLHRVHFDNDTFVNDLKHTLESDCVLTLSRLSKWAESVGEYLSALLSAFLSLSCWKRIQSEAHSIDHVITSITNSAQMAMERKAFMQSAFTMPSSSTVRNSENSSLKFANDVNISPKIRNIIDMLKSNLEGANISAWAFEVSRSTPNESELEKRNWLALLKDQIERSHDIVAELESYLPHTDDDKVESATQESLCPKMIGGRSSTDAISTLVSDGVVSGEVVAPSKNEAIQSLPMDKTLIFSGNGSKPNHTSKHKSAKSSKKRSNAPHPPYFCNQTILLQDLQSRLKAMGLADEYEVATAVDSSDGELKTVENGRSLSQQGQNPPLFLGVSGTALAELSSAMKHKGGEQIIIE